MGWMRYSRKEVMSTKVPCQGDAGAIALSRVPVTPEPGGRNAKMSRMVPALLRVTDKGRWSPLLCCHPQKKARVCHAC